MEVLSRVKRGEITLTKAAELLQRSYRQTKRRLNVHVYFRFLLGCVAMQQSEDGVARVVIGGYRGFIVGGLLFGMVFGHYRAKCWF